MFDDLQVPEQSGGVTQMYLPKETVEIHSGVGNSSAEAFDPALQRLRREKLFARFLCEEMSACRTETEREVVRAALLASKVRILQLTKALILCEKQGQVETASCRDAVETRWKSSWNAGRPRKRLTAGQRRLLP